jgi:hypothetical protein
MRHVPRPFSTFGRSSAVSRSRSSAVSVDSIARPVLVRCCEVTSRVLLVAEHRGVAPSPFPHRRSADHLGVEDFSSSLSFRALRQIGQSQSSPPPSVNCSSRRSSGGHPSQATPLISPGRPSRTASLVAHTTTCLPCPRAAVATKNATSTRSASSMPVSKVDENLPVHRLLPPSGGPVARLALRLSLLFHERRTFRPFGACRRTPSANRCRVREATPRTNDAPARPARTGARRSAESLLDERFRCCWARLNSAKHT